MLRIVTHKRLQLCWENALKKKMFLMWRSTKKKKKEKGALRPNWNAQKILRLAFEIKV